MQSQVRPRARVKAPLVACRRRRARVNNFNYPFHLRSAPASSCNIARIVLTMTDGVTAEPCVMSCRRGFPTRTRCEPADVRARRCPHGARRTAQGGATATMNAPRRRRRRWSAPLAEPNRSRTRVNQQLR